MGNAFKELKKRGYIYQTTNEEKLEEIFEKEKIIFYVGFDPTGADLHVGHLLPIMGTRILQKAGHKPIVLIGGATALVGDPSGKQEARPILSEEQVEKNLISIKSQLGRFIDTGNEAVEFVNNADWFKNMLYLDFLRDVGSRVSVNRMLAAESVKLRLETGLSFLEFNYMLLQGYDFFVLNRDYGCCLQIGGQDQWGNIVTGIDLIRRFSEKETYGITFPLLTDSSGHKFGKTEGGAIWLNKEKTSVFDYYQFWRNCEDKDVRRLLMLFTTLPTEEVEYLGSLKPPEINRAKEILAYEATALAHGKEEAEKAWRAACSKFGYSDPTNKIGTSSLLAKLNIEKNSDELLPKVELKDTDFDDKGNIWIVKLFSLSGLCKSNGEARRLISSGGAYINDERITDINFELNKELLKNKEVVIRSGKKKVKKLLLT